MKTNNLPISSVRVLSAAKKLPKSIVLKPKYLVSWLTPPEKNNLPHETSSAPEIFSIPESHTAWTYAWMTAVLHSLSNLQLFIDIYNELSNRKNFIITAPTTVPILKQCC